MGSVRAEAFSNEPEKEKIKDGEEPAQIKGGGTHEAKGESSPYSP